MNFKLLKEKNFLLLMLGKFISLIGTQMQDFALSLYVLKKTGSATLFSTVLIVALVPQLILSPVAGVFADWLDRKKIIVYLDLFSGIVVGSFAGIYLATGKLSLISIYTLVILISLSSTLYQPAIGTIIPSITNKENLSDANSISSLLMNVGNLVAPMLAGILFGLYGLFAILIINSLSFIISSVGEIFITIPKTNKMPEKINFKAFNKDFTEGIKFIKNNKLILSIIILASILNFVLSPLGATGLAYVSKKILKVSDSEYGIMQMFIVSSTMLAPFIMNKISQKLTAGKIIFWNMFTSSLLIALMSIVPSSFYLKLFKSNLIPVISIVVFFSLAYALITIVNIATSVMFQKIVPLSMMGRVGTVLSTGCMAMCPLGLLIFGLLFDNISSCICLLIMAVIMLISILGSRKYLISFEEKDSIAVENAIETEA